VKVDVGGRIFYVGLPTPIQQFEAEELFQECLVEGRFLEMVSDREMVDRLQDLGYWTLEDQQFLDNLSAKLEHMKVEMYTNYISFRSKRVEQIRRSLQRTLAEAVEIFKKRHTYDVYTCEGFALSCKLQYIVCATTCDINGKPIDITEDGNLVQAITQQYVATQANETELRDLSRNEPWRSIWHAGKSEGKVFGVPAVLLTEDQKQLLTWSRLYDNVRESPDVPDDIVIEDDHLLDGWLIVQSREAAEKKKGQGKVSDKMSRAGEVFVPVETAEDAQRVYQMNDAQARMIQRQRLQLVAQKGEVAEQYMPDSQLAIRRQAISEAMAAAKSKSK
jgi:hypothetical protein